MRRGPEGRKKRSRLSRVAGVLVVLFFPFPLALLYALGIPLEWRWPYLLVYAIWAAFALLLDRIGTQGWPVRLRVAASRGLRWPHQWVTYVSFGLLFVWFLISRIRVVSDPVLIWLVWNIIVILGLVEAAIVGSERDGKKPVLGD